MKVTVEESKKYNFHYGKLYVASNLQKRTFVLCTKSDNTLIGVAVNQEQIGSFSEQWAHPIFTEFHGKITLEQE